MDFTFFSITAFFVVVVNGLWYHIKFVLRQNGYESHLFSGHFGDIQNLHRLVNRQHDAAKKSKLQNLLFAFYITLFLSLASFVAPILVR